MALWLDLVVRRPHDCPAPAADRGLRLEHRCGFGLAPVFNGSPDLRCHNGLCLSVDGAPLRACAALRPARRRARGKKGTSCGHAGSSSLAVRARPRCTSAYPARLTPRPALVLKNGSSSWPAALLECSSSKGADSEARSRKRRLLDGPDFAAASGPMTP